MSSRWFLACLFIIALFSFPGFAFGQWIADGAVLSTAADYQYNPTIVSNGAGGAIVVWYDFRTHTNQDIYTQAITAAGATEWTSNGVALCTASDDQQYPYAVSDGSGGAIVVWHDARSGADDIYTQRVSSAGTPLWTSNGIVVCNAAFGQTFPRIVADGSGGAIMVWADGRNGNSDIYAQRVNASGATQWASNGVVVASAVGPQLAPELVTDGAGGSIVVWEDTRGGFNDIYSQRLDAAGNALWTPDGISVCSAAGNQYFPHIVSDGGGGAIATWSDKRGGSFFDIYAQHIQSMGSVAWATDGVAVCTAANDQDSPALVADGSGGATIAWADLRNGTNYNVFAQHFDSAGSADWTINGVAICTATGDQINPTIVEGASGGTLIAWQDKRSGAFDVYAQGVSSIGGTAWTVNGVVVSNATGDQLYPEVIADGAGGLIATWQDGRTGSYDIYALRLAESGVVPTAVRPAHAGPKLNLSENYPNPFAASTTLTLQVPTDTDVTVDVYDVGGRVVRSFGRLRTVGRGLQLTFDGRDDEGRQLPSGVYFYRVNDHGAIAVRRMVLIR
jgi:hypothetical protein